MDECTTKLIPVHFLKKRSGLKMDSQKREQLASKLITPILPLYEKDFPLIFFWSPKCGCTSLIRWYFFQIGLLQNALNYNPWVHFYREEVYEKKENYKLLVTQELLNAKKDVYKLVRNPYQRAVSSFFTTLNNKHIMDKVHPTGLSNSLSFKQFLYQIKGIGVKKELIDIHIAQQYIDEEEVFIKNHVHLEQFTNEIREIEKRYNLPESPISTIIKSPHHRTHKMTDKGKQNFAEVKMSQETLGGPLPWYQNFYDKETIDLVRELFKKDFEKYGYNKNIIS